MKGKELNSQVLDIVQEKYNIVDIIELSDFNEDLCAFSDYFQQYQSYTFEQNQRLVVYYQELDYFTDDNSCGFTLYNFLKTCAYFDISTDHIILFTNYYKVEKTVKQISEKLCNNSGPIVIYCNHWWDRIDDVPQSQIVFCPDKLFVCLNGYKKQFRVFTLCALMHARLLDNGLVSYFFRKEPKID